MAAERCHCGHMRVKHYPDGGPCHICPGCWYWTPEGEEVPDARDQVGVDPTTPAVSGPTAGPPDLQHATQVAHRALWAGKRRWRSPGRSSLDAAAIAAEIAVEAAAPVLLQATRDRLADLKVQVAELHYLLAYSNRQQCQGCGYSQPEAAIPAHSPDCQIARALAALDGPAAQGDGG